MAKKSTSNSQASLGLQKQLFTVVGNLSVPVNGSTSWAFVTYADTGEDAIRIAKQTATRYSQAFTPEVCQYVRAPRIKGGRASYNRTVVC